MKRPRSTECTESVQQVVDADRVLVGDALEVNPDYLVVVRREHLAGTFIPQDRVRRHGTGWALTQRLAEAPWDQWRDEQSGSAWAPRDGAGAHIRAATRLTRAKADEDRAREGRLLMTARVAITTPLPR